MKSDNTKYVCEVRKITSSTDKSKTRVKFEIEFNGEIEKLWLEGPNEFIDVSSAQDAILAFIMIPSLRIGGNIKLNGPIDSKMYEGLLKIVEIYKSWYPKIIKDVSIEDIKFKQDKPKPQSSSSKSAAFFSGGVDSFYTFLKNEKDIDNLFFIHGFDVFLDDQDRRELASSHLKDLKKELKSRGKTLVEIETNLHDFSVKYASWPQYYHGSALAGISMLLSKVNSKFLIASTHSYNELFAYGSHVLTDELWSTNCVQMFHDGAEANRIQKISYIAQDDTVLRHLRVCVDYNCSKCPKCLFTMIGLDLAGQLKFAETFDNEIQISDIRNIKVSNTNQYTRIMEPYIALANKKDRASLRKELGKLLASYKLSEFKNFVSKNRRFIDDDKLNNLLKDIN